MLFLILAGAAVFSHALTKMLIPQQIVQLVLNQDIGTYGFLLAMMVLIFILGMFLESIAIILVTSPVILPVMAHLGSESPRYGDRQRHGVVFWQHGVERRQLPLSPHSYPPSD